MEIKNILICSNKYADINRKKINSTFVFDPSKSYLIDTINSIKKFNINNYFFDFYKEKYPYLNLKFFLNFIAKVNPDLIVFDAWRLGFTSPISNSNGFSRKQLIFYKAFFKYIKYLEIPIVLFWADVQSNGAIGIAKQLEDYVTLHNVWDIKRDGSFGKNYLFTPTPINSEIYNNLTSVGRDIDITFIGSVGDSKPFRRNILNRVKKIKINSEIIIGGLWLGKDNYLTDNRCADIYRKSKMVINFCLNEEGRAQVKGRVFETTLCGALLLEQENNETSQYFTPYVDYIPWKDETDLIEKIKYYLSHDEERKAISLSGSEKANKSYTGKVYWELIIEKINHIYIKPNNSSNKNMFNFKNKIKHIKYFVYLNTITIFRIFAIKTFIKRIPIISNFKKKILNT